jgi:3-phosphoshikimate 1-carboxyvinyltransferase
MAGINMVFEVKKSQLKGKVTIPGSKSHTVRALFFAGLANGKSIIKKPLLSNDTESAITVCRAMGAAIEINKNNEIEITGFGKVPKTPEKMIDVGNSGTTLRIALSTAALSDGKKHFTGDEQIRERPLGPLIDAINNLGGKCVSVKNNRKAPVIVEGTLKGGRTELEAVTSQYLTSLLMNLPLAIGDSEIEITLLNEAPYIDITLWWLDKMGIQYINRDYKFFKVFGNQEYKPFSMKIPGDFSSATFFAVLAAISGSKIVLDNLDNTDPQGDKEVFEMLRKMGAKVLYENNSYTVEGKELKGIELDLNNTPDALPALAVAACFAEGETRLVNVPQARVKETDRIKVMCEELSKMGADIKELPDGLIIKKSKLKATKVKGHYDHRVVMALSIAGLCIEGKTEIDTAEAVSITFPGFAGLVESIGGNIKIIN